jgi:hypothetical protein
VTALICSRPPGECRAYLKLYRKRDILPVCLRKLQGDKLVVDVRTKEHEVIPLSEVQWIKRVDDEMTGGA